MRRRLKALAYGPIVRVWDRIPAAWRRRVLFATNAHFLVGVLGLVTDDDGQVLLLEHRFRTPWRWGLPGGFVTRGESLPDALVRELVEEIGLAVDVDPEPVDFELNSRNGTLSVTLPARARFVPAALDIRSDEILQGGFYRPEALPDGLYPYHRAIVLAHLPQVRRDGVEPKAPAW